MTRSLILAFLLALAPALAGANGLPPQLKAATTIEDDVIRLGDLWENLGAEADTAIAAAPQPGQRIALEPRWLAAVAQAYGIDWRPQSNFERSVIERAGQSVDIRLIESELREALTMEGAPANSTFEIANRAALSMVVPMDVPAIIGVRDTVWDPRMNRFSATVEVPAGSPSATRVRISGRVYSTVRVPVLNRVVTRGEIITESDIEWSDLREEKIHRDAVLDPSQMIGQEPRWQLRPGQPLRTAELTRPLMVKRNATVTLVLRTPTMSLTAQGRATEDGGEGDIIRVTNLATKRVVEGRVEAPGIVSVALGGPLAANY